MEDAFFAAKLIEPLPSQKVNGRLQYSRLGYIGSTIIERLPKEVTRAIIEGPKIIKYKTYIVSKAYKIILRRRLIDKATRPFFRIYVNLI